MYKVYGRVQRNITLHFSHLKCTEKDCEQNVQSLWASIKRWDATVFPSEVQGKGLWIKCTSLWTSTKRWDAKVFPSEVHGKGVWTKCTKSMDEYKEMLRYIFLIWSARKRIVNKMYKVYGRVQRDQMQRFSKWTSSRSWVDGRRTHTKCMYEYKGMTCYGFLTWCARKMKCDHQDDPMWMMFKLSGFHMAHESRKSKMENGSSLAKYHLNVWSCMYNPTNNDWPISSWKQVWFQSCR